MAKKIDETDKIIFDLNKGLEELQKLVDDMISVAKEVKDEFDIDIDDPELSGSFNEIVRIHEDSPFLDEIFEGDNWKNILKKKDKKDDSK